MPPPPPSLPDDLLETTIFLRLPPDEPACLVRASLASKEWLARLTDPAFCTPYRDFHGAAPVLGFFYSANFYPGSSSDSEEETKPDPLFVSTKKFRARIPDARGWRPPDFEPWDCRHGRVLLGDGLTIHPILDVKLVVLDPMSGCCWWQLSLLGMPKDYDSYVATVLCDVPSCDHRSCHKGPFRVVVVGIARGDDDGDDDDYDYVAYTHVSSPVTGQSCRLISECIKPSSSLHLGTAAYIKHMPPVLIQDTFYFMVIYEDDSVGILKYDLPSECLSLIDAPLEQTDIARTTILMGMEDGSLGFAHLDGLALKFWSMEMRSDGVGLWTECRVINLKEFLPIQDPEPSDKLLGSMEGRDIILVLMDTGVYEISLKSLDWKKIWKSEDFNAFFSYMSFYDPLEK